MTSDDLEAIKLIKKKNSVAIVGAGFSGLTLAKYLTDLNITVTIFELKNCVGGLISTDQTGLVPSESAAHAILADSNVEMLFTDLNLKIIRTKKEAKKRWIFRNKPKRIPLEINEILRGITNLAWNYFRNRLKISENETVKDWVDRCLNLAFTNYLISPALNGIYATSAECAAAELILPPIIDRSLKPEKSNIRGSIAPELGMEQLIQSLKDNLLNRSVMIHLNSNVTISELFEKYKAVVIATSAPAASDLINSINPELASTLKNITMQPVVSVTTAYKNSKKINGFGCLFPLVENFNSLGVLFNTDIFSGRGLYNSETWIFKDSHLTDDKILDLIKLDRKRAFLCEEDPIYYKVNTNSKSLPIYGNALKKFLLSSELERKNINDIFEIYKSGCRVKINNKSNTKLYLTGNYLGAIGLSKILDYNKRLSKKVQRELL